MRRSAVAPNWWPQVRYVLPIIPRRLDVTRVYGAWLSHSAHGALFICDMQMVVDPTAEQVAEMTVLAAEAVTEFGMTPRLRCCRIRISVQVIRRARARCVGHCTVTQD